MASEKVTAIVEELKTLPGQTELKVHFSATVKEQVMLIL